MSTKSEPQDKRHAPGFAALLDRLVARAGEAPESAAGTAADDVAVCSVHGAYPRSAVDESGVRRFFANDCPACAKQTALERVLARAAIAPRFAGCTFDTFVTETDEQRAVKAACMGYARPFADTLAAGRCLVLHGTPGTGKNHLAVAISREAMEQGHSVLHMTAQELVLGLRASWGDRGAEAALRRALTHVDLLCLDEVGRTYGTDGERVELFSVLDARYRAMKPTVVLSNGTPHEIAAFLGKAVYDRLGESDGLRLAMEWPSVRRRAAALKAGSRGEA